MFQTTNQATIIAQFVAFILPTIDSLEYPQKMLGG